MPNSYRFLLTFGLLLASQTYFSLVANAQGHHPHRDSTQQNQSIIGLPVLFFLPETGIAFGGAGVYFWRFAGVSEQTRLSSIQFLGYYTQRKQTMLRMPYELHFDNNRHVVKGMLSWFHYPLQFFGVGPSPAAQSEVFASRTFWLRTAYLYQIRRNLFIGMQYRLDQINDMEYEDVPSLLRLSQLPGTQGGRASGLGVILSYDCRDNIYVPQVGPLIEVGLTANPRWLGSDFEFVRLELDARHYFQLPKHQILGIHGLVDASWGTVPFQSMGLLGHNTINRGYYEGRYRDQVMAAAQVEWRVPLWRGDGERATLPFWRRFSVAVFASLGNVAPNIHRLSMHQVKYGYGAGLRFLFNRKENVTLRLDYGRGRDGNEGIYFVVGEAF